MADDRLNATALYRAVLLAFALVVALLIFPVLASLVLLVLLIVIAALPLTAATSRLERLRIPRAVGAPVLMLAGVAVLGTAVALLVPVFQDEGRRLLHSLPSDFDAVRRTLGRATHASPSRAGQDLQGFIQGYTSHPQKLLGPATTIGAGLAGVLAMVIVMALTALFTAISPRPLVDGAVRLVHPSRRDHARHILHRLASAYVGWLRGLAVGMLVLWVITYAGLVAIGLPYAFVFATITAIAMVVPYYGALVSSIPPILLGLTISPGTALLVAGLYLVSHQVEGNLIEPLVMARAVELHPALVAIGVLAVERLFGFVGLLVAVPILVTFRILVEELWIRPVENAAVGRPPPDGPPVDPRSRVSLARGPARR